MFVNKFRDYRIIYGKIIATNRRNNIGLGSNRHRVVRRPDDRSLIPDTPAPSSRMHPTPCPA
jgi:hypothetical protein